ncbi:MAG: siphovirus Gp157 family protein [Silvanigrellaceae bacterium]|nr:siphovirus Gp157 family protein [Silvanigrellaceae bacterium]
MTKKDSVIIPVKIPLAEAQKKLAEFMEYLEITAGEIPDDLIPSLDAAEVNSQTAADRRIYLIDALDIQINHFNEIIKDIKLRQAKLIKAQDDIYKKTLDVMRENNIREIHGSIKSFKIRNKGGAEAINWHIDFVDIKNVINEFDENKIPKEFIEEKLIKIVNKKALSEVIKRGDDIPCGSKAGREEILAIV